MSGLFFNLALMRQSILLLILCFLLGDILHMQAQPVSKIDSLIALDSGYVVLLRNAMDYHQALVSGDAALIKVRTSKKLRYAHSNGWVETQQEQLDNLKTGYLDYHSYHEDSLNIYTPKLDVTNNGVVPPFYNDKHATLDFNATIDVSLNGKRNVYLLHVSEVWRRSSVRRNDWKLIGRKASKL